MIRNILFLALMQLSLVAGAADIRGKIIDERTQPVPFVNIMLMVVPDSTVLKIEVTNESGEYLFQNIPDGSYILQTHLLGFEQRAQPLQIAGSSPVQVPDIRLVQKSRQLSAVNVQAERPFIERQADKLVVNVENSIIHKGSSLMEVFEKMPGVQVDQDGNIRLRGKQGVIIVIDGKPTTLSGTDLTNMLRGLSSDNVQKVEIITNPSAKWDASGNSGILNIVMKKNTREGYNGSISANYGQGRYPKYGSALSLSYKKNKMNLFFNYGYNYRKGFNNLMIDRKFYDEDGTLAQRFITNNYITHPFTTHNPRLGLDYNLSAKTTVSLLGVGYTNVFKPHTTNHTNIVGGGNEPISTLNFRQDSRHNVGNYEANAQINHRFDTAGQSLLINLDYGFYDNNSRHSYSTLVTDPDGTMDDVLLNSDQFGTLQLYSAKADYTRPLPADFSLEAGLKSSLVKSDKDMRFFSESGSDFAFDSARSSHFLYDENINAAYISLNKKIKNLTLQGGLRAEQTNASGFQKLNNAEFTRDYVQVFPTFYLNYDFGKNNINLNLGRRINRPAYEQMNPFRRLIDFTTYAEGNPYLLPELSYISELAYSHDNTWFVTFNYSFTTDNITDVLIQDAATKTTVQSVVNLEELRYYSLDLTFSKRLTSFWKTNTNVQGYFAEFTGTVNNFHLKQGDPAFAFSTSNNFTLTENLSAELSVRYNHQNLYGVTTFKRSSSVTAGLQRSLFQKKATVTVNMTDIFWDAYPKGITDFDNVVEDWTSRRDTRVLNIAVTYNFGKGKAGRIRRTTGADEEKGRIQ